MACIGGGESCIVMSVGGSPANASNHVTPANETRHSSRPRRSI
jgi:hypothetical protein